MNRPETPEDLQHAGVPKTLRQHLLQGAAILAFTALFAGPLITYGCRGEVDRWRAASAMLQYENGEVAEAIATMEQIVEDSDDEPSLIRSLAAMLRDTGRAGDAVDLCDKWLEKSSGAHPVDRARMLEMKASCQQMQGEAMSALETIKELHSMAGSVSTASPLAWLNDLAYYRALAGTELGQAEDDMNRVIEENESDPNWQVKRPVAFHAKTALCAAIVLRDLDRADEAIDVLDRWINRYEDLGFERESRLVEWIYQSATQFPFKPEVEKQLTAGRREVIDRSNAGLAMMLTLRALIAQSEGDTDRMETDRIRIASLGFESEWLAERLPTMPDCIVTLEESQAYLDTRGYVRVMQKKYRLAMPDLNLAILASETLADAMNSPLFNSIELSSSMGTNESRDKRMQLVIKTQAILLAHRMQAYQESGRQDLADRDAEQIRELGFDPEERLF
ncbi:MAG: hypothetical protein AAF456_06430 [Planctomycetota bacterium]